MKKQLTAFVLIIAFTSGAILLTQCSETGSSEKQQFGGFESQVKWGEHLVTIGGCHDCHTPKIMGPMGPADDSTILLSGHPANMPIPDIDRAMIESKGLVVTQTLTSWAGPWGVSFSANLTSDSTGIGAWKEEQFFMALREGKYKGLAGSRELLPPMPWHMYRHMTDDELKAVFAYLKSTKPIKNVVPAPLPPVTAPPM
jgi:mono/diheme cytochrome c family protein